MSTTIDPRPTHSRGRLAAAAHALALALLVTCLAPPASAQIGETEFVDGNTPIPKAIREEIGDTVSSEEEVEEEFQYLREVLTRS